jgi:hypothetical protein
MKDREDLLQEMSDEAGRVSALLGPHGLLEPPIESLMRERSPLTPLGEALSPARTRASTLAKTHEGRKRQPLATGLLDYFPDALVAVAEVSYHGSRQQNPDQPTHWDRSVSQDEEDAAMRHFIQRGTLDKDGLRHSAKFVWRALAFLQKEIELEQERP